MEKKSYEHKENNGSMFPNDKGDNKKRPDYKGSINIDGTLYNISAWKNEAKSGKKYLGLVVQLPVVKEQEVPQQQFEEKDLPF
tara:strand:+ start:718 stop:966 length:249 start_codon:yes stop_codon:yes gene_type:complete